VPFVYSVLLLKKLDRFVCVTFQAKTANTFKPLITVIMTFKRVSMLFTLFSMQFRAQFVGKTKAFSKQAP